MKTLALILLLCIGFSGFAQKNKQSKLAKDTMVKDIPARLMEKFRKDHPDAIDIRWTKENEEEYKVMFKDPPNTQQLIVYDQSWKVIRKETELDFNEIPDSIINYYKQNYPQDDGYKVWLYEDQNGRTYFSNGTEFGLIFDLNGKLVKHVPKHVK
jgi:hypothetical protein